MKKESVFCQELCRRFAPKNLRQSTLNPLDTNYYEDNSNINEVNSTGKSNYPIDHAKIDPKHFNIDVYSIFYDDSGTLVLQTLYEHPNPPDGVFIIIQTNFSIPKI